MKYRKKPAIVEAYQWFLEDEETKGVFRDSLGMEIVYFVRTIHDQKAYLHDRDWVISEGDDIHYYPCKPDIFLETYERYTMHTVIKDIVDIRNHVGIIRQNVEHPFDNDHPIIAKELLKVQEALNEIIRSTPTDIVLKRDFLNKQED